MKIEQKSVWILNMGYATDNIIYVENTNNIKKYSFLTFGNNNPDELNKIKFYIIVDFKLKKDFLTFKELSRHQG